MQDDIRGEILKSLKRVVIKIGSSIITQCEKGQASSANGLNADNVRSLAGTIRRIVDRDCEVVLVSSGAIMAGRERLGLHRANWRISDLAGRYDQLQK